MYGKKIIQNVWNVKREVVVVVVFVCNFTPRNFRNVENDNHYDNNDNNFLENSGKIKKKKITRCLIIHIFDDVIECWDHMKNFSYSDLNKINFFNISFSPLSRDRVSTIIIIIMTCVK